MVSKTDIVNAITTLIDYYPLKKVSYFGSYADGRQRIDSDLDVLVEFKTPAVSLITLSEIKNRLEDILSISVDIIHAPISDDSILQIGSTVIVYEQ